MMNERKDNTNMGVSEKAFDPTVCFTFFGNWVEAIETAETDVDRNSEAYMLFRAIANYSMYGEEPDFDLYHANASFQRFWPMLTDQIDKSVGRRKGGFQKERITETQQRVIDYAIEHPNASCREIGIALSVGKSTVDRTIKKHSTLIKHGIAVANADASALPESVDCSNVVDDADYYSAYGSNGTGQRDTAFLDDGDLPF